MGSDHLIKLDTWINTLYAVNENMRGHTVGYLSCGVGIIHGKASNRKLSTKITTEYELVTFIEYVPYKIHVIFLNTSLCSAQKYYVLRQRNCN